MKKAFAVLVVITFLGTSLSLPAYGAIKAGAKCVTKGQIKSGQGVKYTCVKSGKRLIWTERRVQSPKESLIATFVKNICMERPHSLQI